MSRSIYGNTKPELVKWILDNPTYSPDSGLVTQLRTALERLSVISLGQLAVIIAQKTERSHEKTTS